MGVGGSTNSHSVLSSFRLGMTRWGGRNISLQGGRNGFFSSIDLGAKTRIDLWPARDHQEWQEGAERGLKENRWKK